MARAAALVAITVYTSKKFGREGSAHNEAPITNYIFAIGIFFQFLTFIAID